MDTGRRGAGRCAPGAAAAGATVGVDAGAADRDGSGLGGIRLQRAKLGIAVSGVPSANVLVMTVTPPRKSPRHSVVSFAAGGSAPASAPGNKAESMRYDVN